MEASFCSLLFLLALFPAVLGQFPNLPNTYPLSPHYTISWAVEGDSIYLGFEVDTTGWFGFGIAEQTSGSMPGSDIMTVHLDLQGNMVIEDRWASQEALPNIDLCANWDLLSGYQANGKTFAYVKRLLNSTDPQDRPILSGSTKIVWSFGFTQTPSYHMTNRRADAITFYGTDQTALPAVSTASGVQTLDIRFTNYIIPTDTTSYICQSYTLPSETNHVIAIEPVIDPNGAPYVHHFAIQWCFKNETWLQTHATPNLCYYPVFYESCLETVYGWGPGSRSLVLPSDVGWRIGQDSVYFIMLQIHYNNPTGVPNVTDSSGVRFYYTPQLRQYDMGVINMGDVAISSPPLEAGNPYIDREFECPSECTSQWPHDINIFATFNHAHQTAIKLWGSHWSANDTFLGYISRTEYYSFFFQHTESFPPYVFHRGDRINTHCTYDTYGLTSPVQMGLGSAQEMCAQIIFYYPALTGYSACGYINLGKNVTQTLCGITGADIINVTNPQTKDPASFQLNLFGQNSTSSCAPENTLVNPSSLATAVPTTAHSVTVGMAYPSVMVPIATVIVLLSLLLLQ